MRDENGRFIKGNKAWWQITGSKLRNTGRTWITKLRKSDPEFENKRLLAIPRGENHPNWKGEDVGYHALHDWVRKTLGVPRKCDYCGDKNRKMYHWANLSRCYVRSKYDWVRLCVPCHKKYDLGKILI